MSMQDPIADMLTRVRNAQMVQKKRVRVPASRIKCDIAKVLQSEGFIEKWWMDRTDTHVVLWMVLKYYKGKSVIDVLKRCSKPGLRVYKRHDQIPLVLGGLGICIMSTPKGVMTGKQAGLLRLGGELLCTVE